MKKLLYTVLSVLAMFVLYYCSDESGLVSENSSDSKLQKKQLNLNTSNFTLRSAGEYNFTNGGDLALSSDKIESLYNL